MVVLDTDILTHLFAGHERICGRKVSVPSSDIAITVVTWIEVLRGRFDFLLKAATAEELQRAQAALDNSIRSLASIETVLPIDAAATAEFDRLLKDKKLKKIGRGDLLIAAITLANKATLVTRNRKHFQQVSGLQLENWAD